MALKTLTLIIFMAASSAMAALSTYVGNFIGNGAGLTNVPSAAGRTNWSLSSITNAGTATASSSNDFYLSTNPSNFVTATITNGLQGALGFTPLTPAVSTNAALKAAQDSTNALGSAAFLSRATFQPAGANLTNWNGLVTNVFYPSNNPAGFAPSNSLGTAAYLASGTFQAALGFTPLAPTVSTNAALKAAQDATNGLGSAAFTAASAYATTGQLADATNHTVPTSLFPNLTGDITTPGASLVTTLATVATPGTSTKLTYNQKGLVTSGTILSAGDIPAIAESGVTGLVTDLSQKVGTNETRPVIITNSANSFGGSGASLTGIPESAVTGLVSDLAAKGSGTVTSVAITAPAGLSVSGSPITGSGTIAIAAPGLILTNGNSGAVTMSNTFTVDAAHNFAGSGSGLTAIPLATAVTGTLPAGSLPAGVLTNADTRPWTNTGGGLLITNAGVQIGGIAPPTSGLNVSNSTAAAGVSIGTNGQINASSIIRSGSSINAGTSVSAVTSVKAGQGTSGGFFTSLGGIVCNASGGDGVLAVTDFNTGATFNLLAFGGFTAAYPSLKRSGGDLKLSDGAGTGTTNNFFVPGITSSTNGLASFARNLLAPISITVGASPFNWTNSAASSGGGTNTVVVYVDGLSVTGSLAQNGTTVFGSIGQNTLIMQPGEYFTLTYTLGTPTATFKPF